jgi:16S rRNA (cytosine967-C5)-methyltransferase
VAQGGVARRGWSGLWKAAGCGGGGLALDRAPLDVRVNALKAARDALVLPVEGEPLPRVMACAFAPGTPVESWEAYEHG